MTRWLLSLKIILKLLLFFIFQVHYSAVILQGMITEYDPMALHKDASPLLGPLLNQSLPRGYISELVARTHTNTHVFSKIFSPVLQGLFLIMQQASIVENEHRMPAQVNINVINYKSKSIISIF